MLKLILPFPPSVNRLWKTKKTGGMYRSDQYASWRKHAEWALVGQTKGKKIKGPYALEIIAVKPDKRRRDLGNLEKAVSDILQHVQIIEDDYLCQDLHMKWAKNGPECLILIKEHNGEEV